MTKKKEKFEFYGANPVKWRDSKKQCQFCDRKYAEGVTTPQVELTWGKMRGRMCRRCLEFFISSAMGVLKAFSTTPALREAGWNDFRVRGSRATQENRDKILAKQRKYKGNCCVVRGRCLYCEREVK